MPAAWKAIVADSKVKLWQIYCDWTDGLRAIEEDKKSGSPREWYHAKRSEAVERLLLDNPRADRGRGRAGYALCVIRVSGGADIAAGGGKALSCRWLRQWLGEATVVQRVRGWRFGSAS